MFAGKVYAAIVLLRRVIDIDQLAMIYASVAGQDSAGPKVCRMHA